MKKGKLIGSLLCAISLGVAGIVGLAGNKEFKDVYADPLVLDESTDYADAANYGYRTKTSAPEKAYSQTDLENASSPVYTDLQYSSTKSLKLKDKGTTAANNAIAVLNCFGTAEEVTSGSIKFGDIKTKYIEFMMNFGTGDSVDLTISILDLETNAVRLTTKAAITAPGITYLSNTDNSEWNHFIFDLSLLSFNGSCTDASKVGAVRIDVSAAVTCDTYIDQLRLVDAQTFDPSKATRKPFDDKISFYEEDDLARISNFYGAGKYTQTEETTSPNVFGSSTKSTKFVAKNSISAYSNFYLDVWKSGITLDKFGENAKFVGYIKGSFTNVGFTSHAARFSIMFSNDSHGKAVIDGSDRNAILYFDAMTDAGDGWYYFEFYLNDIIKKITDLENYPLNKSKVYGLRLSQGDYALEVGDYYVFDSFMIIEMQEAHNLISDVTNVDTCNSSKEAVEAFKNRYLALNGYDQNMFYNTEIEDNETVYTLGYKLDYMCQYYGIAGLNRILFENNILNNPTSLIIVVIASLTVLSMISLIIVKRRKYQ